MGERWVCSFKWFVFAEKKAIPASVHDSDKIFRKRVAKERQKAMCRAVIATKDANFLGFDAGGWSNRARDVSFAGSRCLVLQGLGFFFIVWSFIMKKSLIALAVMAASGASFAQSTVTVYGIADLWLGSLKASQTSGDAKSATVMGSGGVSGSRWGLTGAEDLGGGLKAVFKFEQGISADTGAAAGFNRQAYVGFEGGFGSVTFGNAWTAFDDVLGASNSGFDSGLSATQGVWITPAMYASNPGNTIKFSSANYGGISFAASYSLDETVGVTQDVIDFNVAYSGGPLAVNFAYQVKNDVVDLKLMTVNGSYNLGMAKVLASYAQAKQGSAKADEYQIGVDVPVSAALTLSAGYAHSKRNADGEVTPLDTDILDMGVYAGRKNSGFGLAAAYSMSKRTTLYGGFSVASGENTAGADTSERNLFAVGVKHTF